MVLLIGTSSSCFPLPLKSRFVVTRESGPASLKSCCFGYGRATGTVNKPRARGIVAAAAFCSNPGEQPILKEAFKEPVAFLGGMFAGVLRLDLNEDPLKEWVSRTVEASGMTEEEISSSSTVSEVDEEAPQEIEIE